MMNLKEFTVYYQPIIENYLAGLYDAQLFTDQRAQLAAAMHYSLTAKAKRIRPLLTLATFLLYRAPQKIEQILPLAAAIEIIHTYSLIHDDLPAMDNDDFRRGMPTCHKKFGEGTAILAGDTLNTHAWELLASELPRNFAAMRVVQVIQRLAQSLGLQGMAGGQMMDLNSAHVVPSEAYLKQMHSLKTGALLLASIELPAVLLEVDEGQIEHLRSFGQALGLLFQITDDILDVTGTDEELGKSSGKDLLQKKLTYTSLWGLAGAKEIAVRTAKKAKEDLVFLANPNTAVLVEIVDFVLNRKQ